MSVDFNCTFNISDNSVDVSFSEQFKSLNFDIDDIQVVRGLDGVTFIPIMSKDGTVSWVNNGGLPNPEPVNVKGATGEKGEKGDKGDTGDKGISITHAWNGTILEITSANGTSSADLKGEQGIQGEKGDKGEQGEPFTYDDFTAEQLANLKGDKGDKGDKGEQGEQGIQGIQGESGVYVGSGVMPDGYNIQINPNGDGKSLQDLIDTTFESKKADFITEVIANLPVYNGEVIEV